MTEEIKRLRRVCFTGHRPEKLNRSEKSVLGGLETAIQQAIADGSNVFISGMARGVDIWAAEIVLRFRSEGEDIKLIFAVLIWYRRKMQSNSLCSWIIRNGIAVFFWRTLSRTSEGDLANAPFPMPFLWAT